MRKDRFLTAAIIVCAAAAAALTRIERTAAAFDFDETALVSADPTGEVRTVNVNGAMDLGNPFFKELGTNGRSCFTCHRPAQGWTITPESVRRRFAESNGLDPIFRTNDGSNCKGADIATIAQRRSAFSLLMTRGLIRVGLEVPVGAEFVIDSVDDPYQCGAPPTELSLYRRPLPSTNLGFLSAVMWDGRESSPTTSILQDLARQADNATMGHAQASLHLSDDEARAIVAFETGLFTAQVRDERAGFLAAAHASGGPVVLSMQPFFIGINDPIGLNPTGAPFTSRAFTIFDAWADPRGPERDESNRARQAIARGQEIFNSKPIVLSGIVGLNNETFPNGVTVPDPFVGTCTTCHDTPNAGNHSVKAPLNIGVSDESRGTPDMPLYTLRRLSSGETVRTTDPGRAMITGRWADIGKFKGPILRGLAARAPYFHNGSASTLEEAIQFYDTRFKLGLTVQEQADLAAFLRAL